jgi:hypothetical protein
VCAGASLVGGTRNGPATVRYGEGALTRVPGKDIYRGPRLFVATLRYSRRSFRRVVWKSSQQTWAELHEQAWRYFGGSCRYVVLDNLKEGGDQADRARVRAVARFSSAKLPSSIKAVLWVRAVMRPDGTLAVTHSVA